MSKFSHVLSLACPNKLKISNSKKIPNPKQNQKMHKKIFIQRNWNRTVQFQPRRRYTRGEAMLQYFNLYCLYKTFIFKLYNGIIEIHRIFYSVFKCTHCENNTFKTGILMSKCFKYMHFFALQYYVTLKNKISVFYSLLLARIFSFGFPWVISGAHCCGIFYKNHEKFVDLQIPYICLHSCLVHMACRSILHVPSS